MPQLGIESNGRLEKTAVYYNGEQISGIKEIFLNIDEDGTFDAVIQYKGDDGNIYTKQIFSDYFVNVKTTEPSFTEEEAGSLVLLTLESDGDIESTNVMINNEDIDGIVNLFVHIKPGDGNQKKGFFRKKSESGTVFIAQIKFRNEDDTFETENIF